MIPGFLKALIDAGHLLGVVAGIGGLLFTVVVLQPASASLEAPERQRLLDAVRQRASRVTAAAVGLLLVTGLLKWMPQTGGVGWLGHGGIRTGFLHVKIGLALVVFHLVTKLARRPASPQAAARRPATARLALALGLVVIVLAVLHQTGV